MTRPALQCRVVRDGDASEPWTFEAWFELAARRVGRGVGLLDLKRRADPADPRLGFVLRTVNGCLGDLERRWVQRLDAADPAQGQPPPAELGTRLEDSLIHHLLALSAACAENNKSWDFSSSWGSLVAPTLDRFQLVYTALPDKPQIGPTLSVRAAIAKVRQDFSEQLTGAGCVPGGAGDEQPSDGTAQPTATAPAAEGGGSGATRRAREPVHRPATTTREAVVAALGVLAAVAALVVTIEVGWEVAIAQGVLSSLLVEVLRPAAGIARGPGGPDTNIGIA